MPGCAVFAVFVHRIDPIILSVGPFHLWWYGLSYTLGFLGIYLWMRRHRNEMRLSLAEVEQLTLLLVVGVLIGGRFVELVFYEWDYYRHHLWQIPAYWLGGMSTHGLLLGAVAGAWVFSRVKGIDFLSLADGLAVPGAWVMGVGRLGNFIDGQIAGAETGVWWAVEFPDLTGFRHPVVLYDGVKNLLLIPLLLLIRRQNPPRGMVFGSFVFGYAFLRLFVDFFREYRVSLIGIGTGQLINLAMAVIGLGLIVWSSRRGGAPTAEPRNRLPAGGRSLARLIALLLLLAFCLLMPSDWTQDVPARYGARHPGLNYSWLYPPIPERAP